MDAEKLAEALRLHKLWLDDKEGGKRANLHGAYLYGANLQGANLHGAYLYGANLQGANLQGAYLRGAYLQGANLQGAYLQGAYLQGAYLQGANLQGANLQGASLYGAALQGANLQGADLQGANLHGASLYGAALQGANLQGANLPDGVTYHSIDTIGSRNATLHMIFHPEWWPDCKVWTGCFYGTLAEFEAAVDRVHPDCKHGEDYRNAIRAFKGMRGNRVQQNTVS